MFFRRVKIIDGYISIINRRSSLVMSCRPGSLLCLGKEILLIALATSAIVNGLSKLGTGVAFEEGS